MKALLAIALVTTMAHAADPMFDQQWGLGNTGQRIWRAEGNIRREAIIGTRGVDAHWPGVEALKNLGQGREVIVAVIDSGIDMGHPEFAGRLFQGKDFLDNAEMKDDIGHGTHVAGIIAANTNGVGVEGITPTNVKILPLKVLSQKLEGRFVYKTNPNDPNERPRVITDIIADAIVHAVQAKASVINLSLGWPQQIHSPRIVRAMDIAHERGVVIVAAAGNNNKDVPLWPCVHPTVICVGAMDNQGRLTEYSNHGGKVDLVAPGEWIVSTNPRNIESRTLRIQGYEAKNGSSQAAPFVAAAAALLKLQNPDISVSGVKAKLYGSATAIPADSEGRFVRFGALSIAGALAARPAAFASVLVKGLVTVSVDETGAYDFSLPIEILGDSSQLPSVSMSGLSAAVSVEGTNLRVRGQISDLKQDTEVPVKFATTIGNVTTQTRATLSFARSVSDSDLIKVRFDALAGSDLLAIQGTLKQSKLGMVAVEDRPTSDFHGYIVARTGADIRVTSIRANADRSAPRLRAHLIPGYQQLLSVIEKDINLDGKNDLVFYGMNTARTHLVLTFNTMEGTPLFGANSRWELPISTFEGLPLKEEGARADFSWIKHTTFLGDVLLPFYIKNWLIPEEDNSRELLYREDVVNGTRLYYWEPYQEAGQVKVRPRVLDTVAVKRQLRRTLEVSSDESLVIERIIPQSQSERSRGTVRQLLSIGEGFFRRFVILTATKVGEFTVRPYADADAFFTANLALPVRSLSDFSYSPNSFHMALTNRSSARIRTMVEGSSSEAWTLQTTGWSNPFFEVVATFEGEDRRTLFFESRYHVYVHDQIRGQTGVHKLPINRDSSFPGVSFSETLQPALVREHGQNLPAVAVNSTLIYGDRFYTMLSSPESFTRPIALSIKIPDRCVALRGQMLSVSLGYSAYTMLCLGADGKADLSFFPLDMH